MSLEECEYLYIAHKLESLYRFFVVVVKMLHNFTLVYLSVYLAFLHACYNNTRPVSALTLFFIFKANCCFFQCFPPVYLQSEYTLTCMPTRALIFHVVAHAALQSVIARMK